MGLGLAGLAVLLLGGVFIPGGSALLALPGIVALGAALFVMLPREWIASLSRPVPRPRLARPRPAAAPAVGGDDDVLASLYALSPGEFEQFSGRLLASMGYRAVQVVGHSGDNGIDVLMRDSSGRQCVAQCKRYRGSVPPAVVRELLGVMTREGAAQGFLITTGRVSRAAEAWAGAHQIKVIDAPRLVFHTQRLMLTATPPRRGRR